MIGLISAIGGFNPFGEFKMDVQEYIVSECERQHTLLVDEMTAAFNYACTVTADALPGNDIGLFVQNIARYVEPDVNRWRTDFTNLRLSHVGFDNGGSACPAGEVAHRFQRWVDQLNYEAKDYGCKGVTEYIDGDIWLVDSYMKQLLDIHPWQDGNGRTASILRNWLLDQMSDPEPLPYYFGE